jgi:CDP-diacylglycerol--serine O-phosphatidyltransferase
MKRIPNIITLFGIIFGLAAVFYLNEKVFFLAFAFCIFGMICDMVDGPIARKYHSESKAGIYLDTLSDIILYLIFPIVLWSQDGISIFVLLLFFVAGFFRLMRFSVQGYEKQENTLYYRGMPVFYNQGILAITLLLSHSILLTSILVLLASVLMVTTYKFVKPKIWQYGVMLAVYLTLIGFGLWK